LVATLRWRLVALALTLVPALFAWWSGRRIARLHDDPTIAVTIHSTR
jgi:hypothetical protein